MQRRDLNASRKAGFSESLDDVRLYAKKQVAAE